MVKTEPFDYMAMMEAIKGLTNMMTMLTQNQLNTGVPPRAPERFPRPERKGNSQRGRTGNFA